MKKVFAILPLVALMTACQSMKPQAESTPASAVVAIKEPVLPTEQYDNRTAREQIRREAQVERSILHAPKWMSELPTSDNAVYANGSAVSTDMSMADYKAKLFAYGKICMAAGGRVNQQSHVFMQDTAETSYETSELAIRAMCPSVDITGTEIKEVKRVSEGGRFRTYVLLVLPTGDANQMRKRKDQLILKQRAEKRQSEVFKEMDQNSEKFPETPAPVKITPSVQLFPDAISVPGEQVVIKETIN
jgi:hypothetical protein